MAIVPTVVSMLVALTLPNTHAQEHLRLQEETLQHDSRAATMACEVDMQVPGSPHLTGHWTCQVGNFALAAHSTWKVVSSVNSRTALGEGVFQKFALSDGETQQIVFNGAEGDKVVVNNDGPGDVFIQINDDESTRVRVSAGEEEDLTISDGDNVWIIDECNHPEECDGDGSSGTHEVNPDPDTASGETPEVRRSHQKK